MCETTAILLLDCSFSGLYICACVLSTVFESYMLLETAMGSG